MGYQNIKLKFMVAKMEIHIIILVVNGKVDFGGKR